MPHARLAAGNSSASHSATAGLTAHAAPGPASSRPTVATSTDSPRISTQHEQDVGGPTAASPPEHMPNRPLKPPPPRHKVPIPASLSRQQSASTPTSHVSSSFAADGDPLSPAITGAIPTTRPRITRAQLDRERAAFFDTRWAGRAEAWGAVRLICDALRGADL
ncbi:MAG: hypothetical protein INR71_08170, partial [Terriglobus roseus]|nr:hypothetical protein [Terriglobus roseus]